MTAAATASRKCGYLLTNRRVISEYFNYLKQNLKLHNHSYFV